MLGRLTSPTPATVQRDAEGGSKKFMSSGLQSRKLRDLCHSFIQQAATESLKPKFSEGTSESPINSPHFDLPGAQLHTADDLGLSIELDTMFSFNIYERLWQS